MAKVQGVGVYAKDYRENPIATSAGMEYARRSAIQASFFDSITNYASLNLASGIIRSGPPAKYRLALSSSREVVVYLHTGIPAQPVPAGQSLILNPVRLPDGAATIAIWNPHTGETQVQQGTVQGGQLAITLPGFNQDLALRVVPGS
jgi:hypothetical protein